MTNIRCGVSLSRWIALSRINPANLTIWHWMKMLKLVCYCKLIVALVKSSCWRWQGRCLVDITWSSRRRLETSWNVLAAEIWLLIIPPGHLTTGRTSTISAFTNPLLVNMFIQLRLFNKKCVRLVGFLAPLQLAHKTAKSQRQVHLYKGNRVVGAANNTKYTQLHNSSRL